MTLSFHCSVFEPSKKTIFINLQELAQPETSETMVLDDDLDEFDIVEPPKKHRKMYMFFVSMFSSPITYLNF